MVFSVSSSHSSTEDTRFVHRIALVEFSRALLASRVSIPRRFRWPRSLTGLEYSNRCYTTKEFRLHAFFCVAGGHYLCIGKHGDFSSSASLNGLPRPTTLC